MFSESSAVPLPTDQPTKNQMPEMTIVSAPMAIDWVGMMKDLIQRSLPKPFDFDDLIDRLGSGVCRMFLSLDMQTAVFLDLQGEKLVIDLVYSQKPNALKQHIGFVKEQAIALGCNVLICYPQDGQRQRLYQRLGFTLDRTQKFLELELDHGIESEG